MKNKHRLPKQIKNNTIMSLNNESANTCTRQCTKDCQKQKMTKNEIKNTKSENK